MKAVGISEYRGLSLPGQLQIACPFQAELSSLQSRIRLSLSQASFWHIIQWRNESTRCCTGPKNAKNTLTIQIRSEKWSFHQRISTRSRKSSNCLQQENWRTSSWRLVFWWSTQLLLEKQGRWSAWRATRSRCSWPRWKCFRWKTFQESGEELLLLGFSRLNITNSHSCWF